MFVGLVMLIAGAASYGLVRMLAASPATAGSVETQSASAGAAAAASQVMSPSVLFSIDALVESTPDPIVLLGAGVALFGVAEGLRRRAL